MTRVAGSCSHHCSRSLLEMSARSPIETAADSPTPCLSTPIVFGPRAASRSRGRPRRARRAAAHLPRPRSRRPSRARCARRLAHTPVRRSTTMRRGQRDDGQVDRARDVADRGEHGIPSISPARRPTRWSGGRPPRRLASNAAPTDPARAVAPTSAMLRGASRWRTAAIAASRSRRSKRRCASPSVSVGIVTTSSPGSVVTATGKPLSRSTAIILWLSGSTIAVNVSIPRMRASAARCARRSVASPRPCQSSATANATSAAPYVGREHMACATTTDGSPATATRPKSPASSWAIASRAARRMLGPPEKKRNARASFERRSRKATSSRLVVRLEPAGPARSRRRAGRCRPARR